MCIASQVLRIGIVSGLPAPLPTNVGFCSRQRFVPLAAAIAGVNLAFDIYFFVRFYGTLVPSFLLLRHRLEAMIDVRFAWVLSLVVLELFICVPTLTVTSPTAQDVPFSIGAIILLIAFNFRPMPEGALSPDSPVASDAATARSTGRNVERNIETASTSSKYAIEDYGRGGYEEYKQRWSGPGMGSSKSTPGPKRSSMRQSGGVEKHVSMQVPGETPPMPPMPPVLPMPAAVSPMPAVPPVAFLPESAKPCKVPISEAFPPVYAKPHKAPISEAVSPVYAKPYKAPISAAFSPSPLSAKPHNAPINPAFSPSPVSAEAPISPAFSPPPVSAEPHKAAFSPSPVSAKPHKAAFSSPVSAKPHKAAFSPSSVYAKPHKAPISPAFSPSPVSAKPSKAPISAALPPLSAKPYKAPLSASDLAREKRGKRPAVPDPIPESLPTRVEILSPGTQRVRSKRYPIVVPGRSSQTMADAINAQAQAGSSIPRPLLLPSLREHVVGSSSSGSGSKRGSVQSSPRRHSRPKLYVYIPGTPPASAPVSQPVRQPVPVPAPHPAPSVARAPRQRTPELDPMQAIVSQLAEARNSATDERPSPSSSASDRRRCRRSSTAHALAIVTRSQSGHTQKRIEIGDRGEVTIQLRTRPAPRSTSLRQQERDMSMSSSEREGVTSPKPRGPRQPASARLPSAQRTAPAIGQLPFERRAEWL
ncbi:hypothetical protein DACRYDRAFT_19622 [Dacryopinax primogenitus]|uniref:Uncharacterized protein n=1 Tax=Dacryopinax primogenitus (strain DJM 731) TaxID=1858805 RepID=M5G8E1_DACPD|nr:uncharacterized protein DACRYDRAFT_19622 [Dacryopinax primogenitus]EJU06481.1 hypothetical protein DACRYDRAFT_19622 [Dacryopinax primogenitus]